MPGTPHRLGPFTEGMNNEDEPETIGDNQLADIVNFELDNDGALLSRPPYIVDADTPVPGEFVDAHGYYVRNDGATFLVCTTNLKTWLYDIIAKTWLEIWGQKASGFTQYDNKVVLISETTAGGYWEAGVFTATPTMPAGSDIVFYQERFWAFGLKGTANQTRVWFSNVTSAGATPTSIWTWTVASDFFEVNKGDGQWVTGLLADVNSLIIFRNGSTWRLTFGGAPLLTGSLDQLNPAIGTDNKDTFVTYESYYLTLSQGILYQFINYQFYPLNTKRVKFHQSQPSGSLRRATALSVLAHRAIVWYYGTTYVYSINTNTWSRWESLSHYPALTLQVPPTSLAGDVRVGLAQTGVTSGPKGLTRIRDEVIDDASGELMICSVRTKSYSLEESAQYKRLFYWVVEIKSSAGVQGIALPSAITSATVTTDAMDAVTTDVLDQGSVDNPLIIVPVYETDVVFPTQIPVRATVKLGQSFSYLRVAFDVAIPTDGTSRLAPARIYSITPYTRIRGGVAEKVS